MRSLKEELYDIIIDDDTPQGRTFDSFIQFLIVISLLTFPLETFKFNSDLYYQVLSKIEIFCVIVFTIEYFLRIILSNNRRKYIFSFYGIIDLLAILPYYLQNPIDLRSIRIFRLFRIFRIFKLGKYNDALFLYEKALSSIKSEMTIFFFFTSTILYIASIGIYSFEHEAQPEIFGSIFDALWWSIVTLTTVGYGDAFPITVGGKIFTSLIVLVGVGIVAVPTGLIASAIRDVKIDKDNSNL